MDKQMRIKDKVRDRLLRRTITLSSEGEIERSMSNAVEYLLDFEQGIRRLKQSKPGLYKEVISNLFE